MLMKWITIIILIFSFHVFAGPQGLDCQSSGLVANLEDISEVAETVSEVECPQPSESDIFELCLNVANIQTGEIDDLEYYLYEDTIKKISCAKSNSSDAESASKINSMWRKYGHILTCNLPGFGFGQNNILRYAVKNNFNAFLSNFVKIYKIDLSTKDPKDGKTILEFCQAELATKEGLKPRPEKLIQQIKNTCKILEAKPTK